MPHNFQNRTINTFAILAMLIVPGSIFLCGIGDQPLVENVYLKVNILRNVLLIAFFFINFYYLLPKYFFNNKEILYFIFVAIIGVIILLSPVLFFDIFVSDSAMSNTEIFTVVDDVMILSTTSFIVEFVIIIALSLLLKQNKQLNSSTNTQIPKLSGIPSEINPHFVFNTLNSLYALTIAKSEAAPDVVIKLSNMLRYIVSESRNYRVPLAMEIEYISNYIDVQRLRISEGNNVEFTVNGNVSDQLITPFVIIPFIENAFKYGVNEEENWQIVIAIATTDKNLTSTVRYIKVLNNETKQSFDANIIATAKRKLKLAYHDSHLLEIQDLPHSFDVSLQINLI